MARDRANIHTDIWADEDWRSLTVGAQWLYQFILESSALNLCGVTDWRPAKWTAMAVGVTREQVEEWASELETHAFVVIDRETEEVGVRSFFRHDGILAQPNPMRGATRQFASIGSARIRGVISFELNRLRDEFPEGVGRSNIWTSIPELGTLLKTLPVDLRGTLPQTLPQTLPEQGANPSDNPSGNPFTTSTSTSTSTEASLPTGDAKLKETRLPADWVPAKSHYELAAKRGVDIAAEADAFRLHAETHDRHAARWNAAFTTWLKKAKPTAKPHARMEAWQW